MTKLSANDGSLALLSLLHLPGVGRRTAWRAVKGHEPHSFEQVVPLLNKQYSAVELRKARDHAASVLNTAEARGVQTFSIFDERYPQQLRDLDDPPLVLHAMGNIAALQKRSSIAIIGTREPTEFGRASARRIARTVSDDGHVVISGLAIGCDTEAHKGCLEGGGTTVAVLAHGLDKVYPAENRELAREIIDSGGCLVSEYPIGARPFRTAFVERDRIQSGLARAIIVIETGLKGGTLHTVQFARDQQRSIACVNHPERWRNEEKTQGNADLIARGIATPLSTSDDLIRFIQANPGEDHACSERISPADLIPQQLKMF